MVQIVGTYEFVSQENYETYLKAFGLPEDTIKKLSQDKAPLIVSALDNSKLTASYGGKEVTFVLNQETEHTYGIEAKIKTVASVNGDTITLKSKTEDGRSFERVLQFTDSGLTSTATIKGVSTVRHYKRA